MRKKKKKKSQKPYSERFHLDRICENVHHKSKEIPPSETSLDLDQYSLPFHDLICVDVRGQLSMMPYDKHTTVGDVCATALEWLNQFNQFFSYRFPPAASVSGALVFTRVGIKVHGGSTQSISARTKILTILKHESTLSAAADLLEGSVPAHILENRSQMLVLSAKRSQLSKNRSTIAESRALLEARKLSSSALSRTQLALFRRQMSDLGDSEKAVDDIDRDVAALQERIKRIEIRWLINQHLLIRVDIGSCCSCDYIPHNMFQYACITFDPPEPRPKSATIAYYRRSEGWEQEYLDMCSNGSSKWSRKRFVIELEAELCQDVYNDQLSQDDTLWLQRRTLYVRLFQALAAYNSPDTGDRKLIGEDEDPLIGPFHSTPVVLPPGREHEEDSIKLEALSWRPLSLYGCVFCLELNSCVTWLEILLSVYGLFTEEGDLFEHMEHICIGHDPQQPIHASCKDALQYLKQWEEAGMLESKKLIFALTATDSVTKQSSMILLINQGVTAGQLPMMTFEERAFICPGCHRGDDPVPAPQPRTPH